MEISSKKLSIFTVCCTICFLVSTNLKAQSLLNISAIAAAEIKDYKKDIRRFKKTETRETSEIKMKDEAEMAHYKKVYEDLPELNIYDEKGKKKYLHFYVDENGFIKTNKRTKDLIPNLPQSQVCGENGCAKNYYQIDILYETEYKQFINSFGDYVEKVENISEVDFVNAYLDKTVPFNPQVGQWNVENRVNFFNQYVASIFKKRPEKEKYGIYLKNPAKPEEIKEKLQNKTMVKTKFKYDGFRDFSSIEIPFIKYDKNFDMFIAKFLKFLEKLNKKPIVKMIEEHPYKKTKFTRYKNGSLKSIENIATKTYAVTIYYLNRDCNTFKKLGITTRRSLKPRTETAFVSDSVGQDTYTAPFFAGFHTVLKIEKYLRKNKIKYVRNELFPSRVNLFYEDKVMITSVGIKNWILHKYNKGTNSSETKTLEHYEEICYNADGRVYVADKFPLKLFSDFCNSPASWDIGL